jgi:tetratricopeptide (TPR) repeat protein
LDTQIEELESLMAELDKAPDNAISFEQHELYQAAMAALAEGRDSEAADSLRRLVARYPDEQALRDLLVRIELKASLATTGRVRPTFAKPPPMLRGVLLILFALALTLMVFAAAVFIIERNGDDTDGTSLLAKKIQECQDKEDRGELSDARTCWQEALDLDPANKVASTGPARVAEKEDLQRLCREAIGAKEGDLPRAVDLFNQIGGQVQNLPERDRVFYDCNWREQIAQIEKQMQSEALWQESQDRFGARDLLAGIDALQRLRTLDRTYRASEVKDLLYEANVELARPYLEANGDCAVVGQAIVFLDAALKERPGDQSLFAERQLAYRYVLGCDAAADGDWSAAVEWWQKVYDNRSNYQDGVLASKLRQAYPQACKVLVDGANGDPGALENAITCLQGALKIIPGDDALEQELGLATEYVAGAEAFAGENWSAAIQRWGPMYAIRPNYQNGLLEANLRQACLNDPEPDAELCPP